MTSTLHIFNGSPFTFHARRRARSRVAIDRGGIRPTIGRPRTHERTPSRAFHIHIAQTARARIPVERGGNGFYARRERAFAAAHYASENSIGIIEAASKFDVRVESVDDAWRRLFPGVPCPYRTRSRLERAVDFVIAHDTTIRKAAAVFSVCRWELCRAYNRRTGKNRQLVGESPERLSLTELARAGNREANYVECGGVE